MQANFFLKCLSFVVIFVLNLPVYANSTEISPSYTDEEHDTYIQSLASLTFFMNEWKERLTDRFTPISSSENIPFTNEDIEFLWNKINHNLEFSANKLKAWDLQYAYDLYLQAKQSSALGCHNEAQKVISKASNLLNRLWHEAIKLENSPKYNNLSCLRSKERSDPNLENNPYISDEIKDKIRPHILSFQHPARSILNSLCLKKRITRDSKKFSEAGFKTLVTRPRSFIRVASHRKMPNYLVKVYLDTVLNEKYHKPSWKWLVQRCEGANKVRAVIKHKKIKHFKVAKKWIYCFPAEPSPPDDGKHMRHLALLVVTDMDLARDDLNYYAWKHYITSDHLDELYMIISRAKGSSYRPDNIAYTNKGKFAFIDTEYPSKGPDYNKIRHFLNDEMQKYWDRLVKGS